MKFIPMDPALARKCIEGFQNELDGEQAKLEALYRQVACPRCMNTSWDKVLDVKHAFADPDVLVPRALLRCKTCQCVFNPHVFDKQGRPMVVETGVATTPAGIHLLDPE